jgi:hypothetical protein
MTPKEKALYLYGRFLFYTDMNRQDSKVEIYNTKQCALIAVNEMFEEISKWAGGEFQEWEKERWKYLQEVKQEIEKL